MPWKPKRPCRYLGCPNLSDQAYCELHRKKVKADAAREYNQISRDKEAQRFYESPAWKRLRHIKLSRQPLCEQCIKENRLTKADMVDHIVEIRDGGSPLDIDNLQSLCRSCHAVKSNRERSRRKQED